MAPLWGLFGLGPGEMIILLVIGLGGPLAAVALVVFIVLMATRKPRDPEND